MFVWSAELSADQFSYCRGASHGHRYLLIKSQNFTHESGNETLHTEPGPKSVCDVGSCSALSSVSRDVTSCDWLVGANRLTLLYAS